MAPSYSPETRQDRITKQWVAFAPSRSDRPQQTNHPRPADVQNDRPVEECPFCPGNEEMLPSVHWELEDTRTWPWRTRAVPNKFSAFARDRERDCSISSLFRSRASRGHQEVIIDTPRHHQSLAQMPVDQVDAVLQTYVDRYRTVRTEMNALIPFLFRNHGAGAGASIDHPHSQLVATDVSPPAIKAEERAAKNRYDETGRCPYCHMIEHELETEDRLVWRSDTFIVFVPYAAQMPFEMWILPRRHEPEFGRLSDTNRQTLATALQTVLARLRTQLNNPDYNLFVRTALEYESSAPHLHWSLRIRPRTSVQAGFEQSTGIQINPSIPERDAAVLRQAT